MSDTQFREAVRPPAIVRDEKRRAALTGLLQAADIGASEVAMLRREIFDEGVVGRYEAEILFAIERTRSPACPEWRDFLIEAILDHVLWQMRPSAVLNEAKAAWLIEQVDAARTVNAFAILVLVLDDAERIPAWFAPAVRGRARKGWPGLAEMAA